MCPTARRQIRIETIASFLKRYRDDLDRRTRAAVEIDQQIAEYERRLRDELLREQDLAALAQR